MTTAIAGIGATEFSKHSGRSELKLAAEATQAALADAGLRPSDVDGLVTFTMDSNAEIALARELGIRELTFFGQVGYGGGAACGTVAHAAMAIAAGAASTVVCYRALNERSGRRFGQVSAAVAQQATTSGVDNSWHYPMGLTTPAAMVAMIARRYMHESGATSEDFGRVTVADRGHAAVNPKAWFYQRPVTLAEHQASRMIADPLRLLDCCQESDGAVALVVTSSERARDLRQPPVSIRAAAQGSGPDQFIMTSYYRSEMAALPEMGVVARQLWSRSGLRPGDIRTAVLYDHFTPYVLLQLEELGFCERGEARHFIAGGAIEMGGRLPLNPHGGQLGEAYIHGMNGIAEAVRQVRGTSVNQVPGDGPVLVTAGTGVPTSALILSAELPYLATFGAMILTAETPDGPIVGQIDGDPGDPALLLLHGGPGLSDYMSGLLSGELDGWRTISFQQRGIAPSATEGPFTVRRHVADAIAVLDAAGAERAVVLGHSWGGHLALQLAVAHPERVTGLLVIDSLGVEGDGGMTELATRLAERVPPESAGTFAELAERRSGSDR